MSTPQTSTRYVRRKRRAPRVRAITAHRVRPARECSAPQARAHRLQLRGVTAPASRRILALQPPDPAQVSANRPRNHPAKGAKAIFPVVAASPCTAPGSSRRPPLAPPAPDSSDVSIVSGSEPAPSAWLVFFISLHRLDPKRKRASAKNTLARLVSFPIRYESDDRLNRPFSLCCV
jgi:hypothetical protein